MNNNNSICYNYLSEWISLINKNLPESDKRLTLTYDENVLLPKILKKTLDIRYSDSSIVSSLLYFCGSEYLFLDYFFATRLFDYNYFTQSSYFLERFRKRLDKEKDVLFEKFQKYNSIIVFQQLFYLFHEVAHGLFFIYPNYKEQYLQLIDEDMSYYNTMVLEKTSFFSRLENYKRVWKQNKTLFTRLSLRQIVSYANELKNQQTIDLSKFKDKEKEEFCCDLYSLLIFLELHKTTQIESDFYNAFFIAAMTGVQLVERLVYLENRFIKQFDDSTYLSKTKLETPRVQLLSLECLFRHPSDNHKIFIQEVESKISTYFSEQIDYVNEVWEVLEQVETGIVEINEDERLSLKKQIDAIQETLLCEYTNKAF